MSVILELTHEEDGIYRILWEPEEGRELVSKVQASWVDASYTRREVEAEDITPAELGQPRVPSEVLEAVCQAEEQRWGR